MNVVDIILVVPLIWFLYIGFKKGLIVELSSLVALILGIYAALHFSSYAENFILNTFNIAAQYVPIAAFVVTFIIVVIIVFLIGKILERFVNLLALGFLNKLAGAVFGLLKISVIISIIFIIFNNLNIAIVSDEKKENSLLYQPIERIAPFLWNKIQDLDIDHEDYLKKFRNKEDDDPQQLTI